eukprot:360133-Chlamydomonas_euryale.AAC.7
MATTVAAASGVKSTSIVDGVLDFMLMFVQPEPSPSELGWRTDFADVYSLKDKLGRGAFGEVCRCKSAMLLCAYAAHTPMLTPYAACTRCRRRSG